MADLPMEVGQELQLSVFLEDLPWALHIDRSVVRWIRGFEFAVESLGIRSSIKERLRMVLIEFKERVTTSS